MLSMEEIYREHSQTVYGYLLSLTRNADTAEELTQETFYQAVKSAKKFDGSCKITTWLCAIAKNVFLSYRRKHPPADILEEHTASSPSPENEIFSNMGQLELMKRMHSLNSEMREVMYLRLLGGLSFREIGDIMSQTENWARVNYYRGKEKIKKELEADEYKA